VLFSVKVSPTGSITSTIVVYRKLKADAKSRPVGRLLKPILRFETALVVQKVLIQDIVKQQGYYLFPTLAVGN
jgi:hypothetical protein